MIVQCDHCNTRFKLDDAKIKESGVKVRCSKCKNVFIVRKETPPDETDFDSLLSGLGGPSPADAGTESAKSHEKPFKVGIQPAALGETPEGRQEEFLAQDAKQETVVAGPPSTGDDEFFAFSDDPLAEENVSMPSADRQATAPEPPEEDDYDFGAGTLDEAIKAVDSSPATTKRPIDEFELGDFAPDQTQESAMDDAKEEIFCFGREFDTAPPEPEVHTELPGEALEPLDFGKMDFGESIAAAPTEKQDSNGLMAATEKHTIQSAALSAKFRDTAIPSPPTMSVSHEEDLPSPGINSRRERTSIVPIALIAIAILLVIALAGVGFYFLNEGPTAFNKLGLGFLAEWVGMEAVEEGGIIVRKPVGTFHVNKEAGEIFVVSGEAVNNFRKPRASIQVKAVIYGPKGESMQQKVAYCGNPLSREQLESLPMDKIEAAMLNQFGDSLTNLGVQSGKTIPFVVVFTNVPKEAGEFGVEVAGSTVASQ
ncbi:MAG: DUF3426 domain-containing protein [Geobacteraceae bacterium]